MSIVALVPVAHLEAANAALADLGFGPANFSVPLRDGDAGATHAGLHAWPDPTFLAALETVPEVDVFTSDSIRAVAHFRSRCTGRALDWSEPTDWFANPVMTGDQRQLGGKTWRSLIDHNVWEPPVGWREVVTQGYPEWVQPTGAHDAYAKGDRVSFESADYESVINANVWSPSMHPAGWTRL